MAEEEKEQKDESKLSFKNADELTSFLMDLQGQIGNMQQTIDKLSPVKDEEESNDGEEGKEEKEMTDDEVNEIDQLLQSE